MPARRAYSTPELVVHGDLVTDTLDPAGMPPPSQKCASPGDGQGNAPVSFCDPSNGPSVS